MAAGRVVTEYIHAVWHQTTTTDVYNSHDGPRHNGNRLECVVVRKISHIPTIVPQDVSTCAVIHLDDNRANRSRSLHVTLLMGQYIDMYYVYTDVCTVIYVQCCII